MTEHQIMIFVGFTFAVAVFLILICPALRRLDRPKRKPSNARMRSDLHDILKSLEEK
jgi:hypothetical protein